MLREKVTKAMTTLAFNLLRRSSTTTSNTVTKQQSWVLPSETYVDPSAFDIIYLKTAVQIGEIKALAGVDFLTISPSLLEELKKSTELVPKKLDAHAGMWYLQNLSLYFTYLTIKAAQANPIPKVTYIDNEPEFRWELLQDQMAFDKLHEGIKKFAEDGATLKKLLREKLSA